MRQEELIKKSTILLIPLLLLFPLQAHAGDFFICSYDFSDADATAIALKYDVVVTDLGEASAISTMKTTNPSIKALHYDNALTHGDNYYVYDTVTGKKIVHDDWGWYLHDISNSNYRMSLANYIAANLATYSQLDGVFFDDVWHSITASVFHQDGTLEDPNLPPDLVDNWQTYMIGLIQEVKSAISSDLLITAVSNNKYYLAQSGVSDGATQEQINKLVSYCHCSFLMGIPSNKTFAKHYFCPSLIYNNYYWYSLWETNLGNPIGDYFRVSGTTDCYRRNFVKGIVLVNPTDTQTGDIDLGDTFYTLSSTAVTQVNLSAREGVILLKDTSPPAPPTGLKIISND
jgi:hypothetical protein